MATATGSIRDRFEQAYLVRTAALGKVAKKVQQPVNKELYGRSYYQDKLQNIKSGYVHPYHT
jgi:hypothetical protein